MTSFSLAPLRLYASPVPTCRVVRVLIRVAVNHFSTVIPVIKRALVSLRGCVQSLSGCVCLNAAKPGCFACGVNADTFLALQLLVSGGD